MKTTKSTLYTIIVLLVIFAPLATYGTYTHFKNQAPKDVEVDPNPNKEFYHNGSLYFYDENQELLGTYPCTGECGYAKTIIDEDEYGIKNYYQDGTLEHVESASKDYVIVEDAGNINLYSLNLAKTLVQYQALKNYNVKLKGNLILVKNNDKWGLLSLENMQLVLPLEYDYLSLPSKIENDELLTDELIAKKDNKWYIIDNTGKEKNSGLNDPIISFNSRYMLTDKNELYDYQNSKVNLDFAYKDIAIVDTYVVFVTNDNVVEVYNDINAGVMKRTIIGNYNTIDFKISDRIINVFIDGTVGTSIDLNS